MNPSTVAPAVHFRYALAQFAFEGGVVRAFATAPGGAFGKVLVGVDTTDDVRKAIKVVCMKDCTATSRADFQSEAEILIHLRKKVDIARMFEEASSGGQLSFAERGARHVAYVYGTGEEPDLSAIDGSLPAIPAFLIVMEPLERTLTSAFLNVEDIEAPPPQPLEVVVRVARELALALAFASHHGVVHSDIKPDNVMLAADGRAVLCDLGLGRLRDDSAGGRRGYDGHRGTPAFIAPELIEKDARSATYASDVFAYGLLLWHLFSGRACAWTDSRGGPQSIDTIEQRVFLTRDMPSLACLRPDTPQHVAKLMQACWSYAPRDRPSALDCAQILSGRNSDGWGALSPSYAPATDAFFDHEPSADKLRLFETPFLLDESPSTTSGLESLVFLCARCNEPIVPPGAVFRVTVRMTPSPPAGAAVDHVSCLMYPFFIQDSVFARHATVRKSAERHPHLHLRASNSGSSEPFFSTIFCPSCGLLVGEVIEEASGELRHYKLAAYRGDRGWVLRLANPAVWHAMKRGIPPPLPIRVGPPQNFERALAALTFLEARTPGEAVDATKGLLHAGGADAVVRVIRAGLAIERGVPLLDCVPCALEDPAIEMLSALPYGRAIVVAPALYDAMSLGGGVPLEASCTILNRFVALVTASAFPASAVDLFPKNVHDLAAYEELMTALPVFAAVSSTDPDIWPLCSRVPDAATFSMFLLLRASCKSSPLPGSERSVDDVLRFKRERLRGATDTYVAERIRERVPALAYMEADIAYIQPRVMASRLPRGGTMSRVPFILVHVPQSFNDGVALATFVRDLRMLELGPASVGEEPGSPRLRSSD